MKKVEEERHIINFGIVSQEKMPSCTCKDWLRHHIPCKHFFAVFAHRPDWPWERLPSTYQNSAYVSMDTLALKKHFNGQASDDSPLDSNEYNNDLPTEDFSEESSSDLPTRVSEVSIILYILPSINTPYRN